MLQPTPGAVRVAIVIFDLRVALALIITSCSGIYSSRVVGSVRLILILITTMSSTIIDILYTDQAGKYVDLVCITVRNGRNICYTVH